MRRSVDITVEPLGFIMIIVVLYLLFFNDPEPVKQEVYKPQVVCECNKCLGIDTLKKE